MWSFIQEGDAARIAKSGDGCGAAMRVAPVGVLYRSSDLDNIVRGAYECAIPTHGGQSAICAATAVAAAVSASLDGCTPPEVLESALKAAKMAETSRAATREHTIADALANIFDDLCRRDPRGIDYVAENYFPNTPETIVPLAICLAVLTQSAEQTALIAANLGGDSDSVASIGGAIAGALHPETVNEDWFSAVIEVNREDIVPLAVALAAMRKPPNSS
jgi:ADP-ribosylglycohydrolase